MSAVVMNWIVALPELVLAVCGMAILLLGVAQKRENPLLASMLSIGALVLAGVLVVSGSRGQGYEGQLISDAFSTFLAVLILVGAALAIMLSLEYNQLQRIYRFEFPVLIVFAAVGMMVMVKATNLMSLYLGLELQSLAIYVLAAFARDDLRSAEAGLKYFVLGCLASGLLLYGISLVYGFSGSMDFARLSRAFATPASVSAGLVVGVVFVLAGLAFKVSVVPFHMWTPDVYEGAPTPVTTFIATAPKVAAMGLLLRTMIVPFGHLLAQWQQLVVLVSIASMVLGALGAIGQVNIKRLMAYSAIGHMGYALIGLAAGTEAGVRGVLIYLLVYMVMSAGAFAVILAMRRRGMAVEAIADLAGLSSTDPALALLMTIFMFSLAGIPPLSGFFGKFYVFLAAVQAGQWTLAIIGVLTSVVGAYYYIRIVKVMYFDEPAARFDVRHPAISIAGGATALFTVLFLAIAGPFISAADLAAKALFG